MKQILGYDVAKWALFFHLETQSKYILDLNRRTGTPSIMTPIAEEIFRVLSLYRKGEIDIGVTLAQSSKDEIYKYIKGYIDVMLKKVKVQPSLMLLASLKTLYGGEDVEYFKPMDPLLGTNVLREFVEDFNSRAIASEHKKLYDDTLIIVSRIINPLAISYGDRKLIKTLKETFKTTLDKAYGDSNAHGMEHIDKVVLDALRLRNKYSLNIDSEEIILAGLLHDIYQDEDRKNHHILASKWIDASIHPIFKDKEKRMRISNAIKEHRASHKGGYSSELSELIATADRDEPNIIQILERMYMYQLDSNPKVDNKTAIANMKEHLEDKFSSKGYSSYPTLFKTEYGELQEALFNTVDKIISGKLKITIARYGGKLQINLKR